MKEYMAIGQIINTHGVKGELKVYPLTDDVKRFRKIKEVYIEGELKKVVWCKIQPKTIILKIEGIDSVEDVMRYRNKYIEIKREDAVTLPKDRYFVTDIIGCNVYDEKQAEIGKVVDVIFTGSNEVYWVKKGNSEVLVPALKSVVVDILIDEKKIIIKPLERWM